MDYLIARGVYGEAEAIDREVILQVNGLNTHTPQITFSQFQHLFFFSFS